MENNLLLLLTALGGLGLFLLGMIVMTEGLRELAGDAIRSALMRFTHTPASGALTGAACTAILQSSSATTVAAVGFVAAGLMSFPSALGIVFGANLGTTVTGWLVALIGFKLKIGMLAMPLVFAGAILRLLANGRLKSGGFVMAGFGLIFVGIGTLQEGMAGMQDMISPDTLPDDTVIGRLQIVLLGMLVTVITQSSSAGVAATMTALYTGDISFEQALALIIGMDIGTSVKAMVATIGASIDARRTGLSHLVYNLFTATLALFLITPYVSGVNALWPGALQHNAEIALVAFHSLFNLVSISLILPFAGRFAHMLVLLVPDRRQRYRYPRERALLDSPALALGEVQNAVVSAFHALLRHIQAILSFDRQGSRAGLAELQLALDETHAFLDRIQVRQAGEDDWKQLLALLHALDHLQRLHERCEEDEDRAITARDRAELRELHDILLLAVQDCIGSIEQQQWSALVRNSRNAHSRIEGQVEPVREAVAEMVAGGVMEVPEATRCLEAIRWLGRVSNHIARVGVHIERACLAVATRG